MFEAVKRGRDLRLDFFRGLALIIILVDHIPGSPLSLVTPGNFGFSDATETFIFISGFSAGIVYGQAMRSAGATYAATRVLQRAWQLYIAHIVLFVLSMGQVSYSSATFSNPMYWEEMAAQNFVLEPHVTIVQALLLTFQPSYMDILPMYIVMMVLLAPLLPLLRWNAVATLALSFTVYGLVWLTHFNLPAYPEDRSWLFNPLAWQALFLLGVALGMDPARARRWMPKNRIWLALAAAYLLFALFIALTWRSPALDEMVPNWLRNVLYPMSKTNLALWRFAHFIALAYVMVRLLPFYERWLLVKAAEPVIVCGQHGLQVFCFGILLSFAGRVVATEFPMSFLRLLAIDLVAIALLIALAYFLGWQNVYRRPSPRPPEAARQRTGAELAE